MPTHTAGPDLPSNEDVSGGLRKAVERYIDGLPCNLFLDWEVKSSPESRERAISKMVELYERINYELMWG